MSDPPYGATPVALQGEPIARDRFLVLFEDTDGPLSGGLHTPAALEARDREVFERVGTLAAEIAHALNNFLTIIQANLHVAAERTKGDGSAAIKLAQAAPRSAVDLSQQLRTIGWESASPRRPVALHPIVATVCALLERAIDPAVRLETAIDPELHILSDPTQLQRVLLNLALNGCEAMPRGGRLLIRAEPASALAELAAPGRSYARIDVQDSGIGMDAETVRHTLDSFFTTKAESGIGLGGAVVSGIVREHEGCVTLDTEPIACAGWNHIRTGCSCRNRSTVKRC